MHLFADLALATSFLGVTLGLFDFMAKVTRRKDNWQGRTQTGLITFVPPLCSPLLPQGFIMALGYAAIALAVLAVLLPVALVWQSRKQAEADHHRVPGGVRSSGFRPVPIGAFYLVVGYRSCQQWGCCPPSDLPLMTRQTERRIAPPANPVSGRVLGDKSGSLGRPAPLLAKPIQQ